MAASYDSPARGPRGTPRALPAQRSAFGAAFLSFVFPGLGQAYAGARARGLLFALPPLLGLGVLTGIFLHYGPERFGLWAIESTVLVAFFVLNLVLLAYRVVAVVDAFRVAQYANAFVTAERGLGRPQLRAEPGALLGLVAVIAVLLYGHVAFAGWDRTFYDFAVNTHRAPGPVTSGGPGASPSAGSVAATPTPAPWTGTGRLNILLVGVDARPADKTFNTDTMIVVSIDPASHTAAMFSLPRDTLGLPTPPGSALAALFGPTYNDKINSLWSATDSRRELFPNGGRDALKQELGYVLGLNIQYYVEVDFDGFRQVVNTFGGVTVNVEVPVVDDVYPGNGGHVRVYIPAGIQHMDGTEALIYARSRHGSTDFDRAARQQQLLTALKSEANLGEVAGHLTELIGALGQTVHTDIPEGPDVMGQLLDLAGRVRSADIKQYVFAPPLYGVEHNDPLLYWIAPDVAKMRAAVRQVVAGSAPSTDPLAAVRAEHAPIVVQNGSGTQGQAGQVAEFLQSQGLNAQSSTEQPAKLGQPTRIEAVNGADTRFPNTLALLQQTIGASPERVTIAGQPPEFIVVTGPDLPALSPPPSQ